MLRRSVRLDFAFKVRLYLDGCRSTQHLGPRLALWVGWLEWGVPSTPGWGGAEMAAHTLLSPAGGRWGGHESHSGWSA